MSAETIAAGPAATTKERMRVILNEQAEQRALSDRLKALPAAVGRWVQASLKTLRLDFVLGLGQRALQGLRTVFGKVMSVGRYFGWSDIAGTVMTAGGFRDYVKPTLSFAYRTATWPLRMLGRGAAWLLNRTKTGQRMVATVRVWTYSLEGAVEHRYDQAMNWLDKNEQAGWMRWARATFQARIVRKAAARVFPRVRPTWLYIASLMVPTFGLRSGSRTRPAVIDITEPVLRVVRPVVDAADDVAHSADSKTADAAAGLVKEPFTQEVLYSTQPGSPERVLFKVKETGQLFEATTWRDDRGEAWYRIDGTVYAAEDLPDNIELGHVKPKAAPAPAKAADKAAGPAVPREVRRAAQKGGRPGGRR